MSVIKAKCTDQVLQLVEVPIIASGGVNEVRVEFEFCEKWDGFAKTAVFYQDEANVYYAVLNEEDVCTVPWEVCYSDGTFYFSVFGNKGETRRTSTAVRCKVRKGMVVETMMPSAPSQEVYDQIMASISDMRAENNAFASEVREENNALAFSVLSEINTFTSEIEEKNNAFVSKVEAENEAFVAETERKFADATKYNIAKIEKTGTEGLVDTYTITFLDGSTKTYTVTNGEKGEQGEKGEKGEQGERGLTATRNWLDNSYFINPVNSGGLTAASYNTCIDRWESGSGDYTMEIKDDGVAITGECDTHIRTDNSLLGKKVTVALHGYHYLDSAQSQEFTLIASGTIPEHQNYTYVCSASNDYIRLDLVANAGQSKLSLALTGLNFDFPATLRWAALYVGEYTAETLPEYQYKGYGVEQLECLGYADKTEIAEMAAELVDVPEVDLTGYAKTTDVPTDAHINQLINTALGVIENGTY